MPMVMFVTVVIAVTEFNMVMATVVNVVMVVLLVMAVPTITNVSW